MITMITTGMILILMSVEMGHSSSRSKVHLAANQNRISSLIEFGIAALKKYFKELWGWLKYISFGMFWREPNRKKICRLKNSAQEHGRGMTLLEVFQTNDCESQRL